MKMTLKLKMGLMGAGMLLALGVLGGVILWSNSVIRTDADMVTLRGEQLALVKDMKMAQTELLLAAMDSIIDRSEGTIAPDRMQLINEKSEFLVKNADALRGAADTEEERREADKISKAVHVFADAIRVDLKNLIEGSARRVHEIEDEFAKMDDDLDGAGTAMEESLVALQASFRGRGVAYGAEMAVQMQLSQTRLLLAAMDSIMTGVRGK